MDNREYFKTPHAARFLSLGIFYNDTFKTCYLPLLKTFDHCPHYQVAQRFISICLTRKVKLSINNSWVHIYTKNSVLSKKGKKISSRNKQTVLTKISKDNKNTTFRKSNVASHTYLSIQRFILDFTIVPNQSTIIVVK